MLHDWCNKGCGMCYPVCVYIKFSSISPIGRNKGGDCVYIKFPSISPIGWSKGGDCVYIKFPSISPISWSKGEDCVYIKFPSISLIGWSEGEDCVHNILSNALSWYSRCHHTWKFGSEALPTRVPDSVLHSDWVQPSNSGGLHTVERHTAVSGGGKVCHRSSENYFTNVAILGLRVQVTDLPFHLSIHLLFHLSIHLLTHSSTLL